jgi:tetratricopeptide (TPR) repeat protein
METGKAGIIFSFQSLVLSLELLYIFTVGWFQIFDHWKEAMMVTLKYLGYGVILLMLMAGAGCCPPNCPVTPPNFTPMSWQPLVEEENYDQVFKETSEVIAQGESAQYYAEARLYHGFSTVKLNGNLDEAKADLEIAESRIEELSSVDATTEQVLLFRGLMIVNVKFGDFETADAYLYKAIELAPDQKDMIIKEYEEAKQQ